MKKRFQKLFIILSIILLVFSGGIFYLFQKRQYFCLSENKCVTLWKTTNDAYIISGKYTSWFKPEDGFIKTSNEQYITIYFSDSLPNTIILREEGGINGIESRSKMYRSKNINFVNYSQDYKKILYKSDAQKFSDVKNGVSYLNIDIFESYAITNKGKILK